MPLEIKDDCVGKLYWSYNCPLQMWPCAGGWRVLNYMPRKERVGYLGSPISTGEMTAFARNAASTLRNLADLFDALADRKIETIYYPDETVEEAIQSLKELEHELH